MKTVNWYVIILVIVALVSLILIFGGLYAKHFESNEISFDYPSNWKTGKIFDLPGALVGVSDSGQANVIIFKKSIPHNSSLKEVYDNSILNQSINLNKYCYQQISNKNITVDGVKAYENIFQIGCNNTQTRQMIKEVWLEKNGYIYIITCTVIPPEDFTRKNTAFEEIINNFHVK